MKFRLPISSHTRDISVLQYRNTYVFKIPLHNEKINNKPKIFINDYDMVLTFIKNTKKDMELYDIIKKYSDKIH
jgi:hypothetical protein